MCPAAHLGVVHNRALFANVFVFTVYFDLYSTGTASRDLQRPDRSGNVCVCVQSLLDHTDYGIPEWRSCSGASGGSWTAGTYWPQRRSRRTWCCCWFHKLHNWRNKDTQTVNTWSFESTVQDLQRSHTHTTFTYFWNIGRSVKWRKSTLNLLCKMFPPQTDHDKWQQLYVCMCVTYLDAVTYCLLKDLDFRCFCVSFHCHLSPWRSRREHRYWELTNSNNRILWDSDNTAEDLKLLFCLFLMISWLSWVVFTPESKLQINISSPAKYIFLALVCWSELQTSGSRKREKERSGEYQWMVIL